MKHFYITNPLHPKFAGHIEQPSAGDKLTIDETDDVELLDVEGLIYLGSIDDNGQPVYDDGLQLRSQFAAELGAIRGPFFKATARLNSGEEIPAVFNADHIVYARPGIDGPDRTWIRTSDGQNLDLMESYSEIEAELFGVVDVGSAK